MATLRPDIFSNVHKGIRSALFEACTSLGRAGADRESSEHARDLLRAALHFVAHHGDNEDVLLLPLLRERAPAAFGRMQRAHATIDAALAVLSAQVDASATGDLYHQASSFITLYLEHMREEEIELEPLIRAAVTAEELADFGRRAVERTSPSDQRLMLAWMLPAMTADDVQTFLTTVPAERRDELRRLARRDIP